MSISVDEMNKSAKSLIERANMTPEEAGSLAHAVLSICRISQEIEVELYPDLRKTLDDSSTSISDIEDKYQFILATIAELTGILYDCNLEGSKMFFTK